MDGRRRLAITTTVFSTWVVLGLFLDGWAHNAGKPEDFWTPWHAVLYSGFVAGAGWFVVGRQRDRRAGTALPVDPLTTAGFVLFAIGGLGDAVWHSILGVEEDVAALLSPTHLLLMLGGLLLIGGPLRRPLPRAAADPRWRTALPEVVAVALAVAVVGFFLQFLSPFHGAGVDRYGAGSTEAGQLLGVASILVTNVLLVAGTALLLRDRDRLPTGAATAVLGGTALLWSSLEGFEGAELVAAAVAAGLVVDLLAHRGAEERTLLVVMPGVLWPAWFAIYHVGTGLAWPAEYAPGVTVLAVLTGWGLHLLSRDAVQAPGLEDAAPAAPASAPPAAAAVGYSGT
ncbi:MAG: hypothetical protein KY461_07230 [Actinobacteria bacterium]|nr:hypothetical protein [Actinomycetota bacterium]